MFNFPKDEIKRKTFHILTLIYVAAYWFLPRSIVLWGLAIAILIVLAGEFIRARNEKFNVFILKVLGGVHRESETHKISGLPWTLFGAFLVILLFGEKNIFVLASFFYLAFGDACAALFGKAYGKHKIYAGKSWEGTIACFAICFVIGLILFGSAGIAGFGTVVLFSFLGAVMAAFIETIPWPLNDNLWMQVLNAGVLTLLAKIL